MDIEARYEKKHALETSQTLATVVHAIVRKQYGEEAYGWDPVTVYLELKDDFSADTESSVMDRWSAMSVIMTSDAFFKRLDAFMSISNTLASGTPFFGVFDPVTTEEAAWAITEVALNRELLPFSKDVKQYLKKILADDGYDEGSMPEIFKEVLEGASSKEIKEIITNENKEVVEGYIDEQLGALAYQFDAIPDLKDLDELVMQRTLNEFLPS